MTEHADNKLSARLRRAVMAIAAGGIMAAPAVHASPSNSIVLVSPAQLPEPARQGGDALLLRQTIDGRTLLYIEKNGGGRLAALDVTDPGRVTTLDLRKVSALRNVDDVDWQRPIPARTAGYVSADPAGERELERVLDVKQVRGEITNTDTGTTYVLAQDGLYLIRRPAVEMLHRMMMIPPN
jgi:hypothetical protein